MQTTRTAFKTCGCGRDYTVDEWRRLGRCGGIVDLEREFPAKTGEAPLLPFELRTCMHCGSTIAKNVPYEGSEDG
jgi:hypothetical protein